MSCTDIAKYFPHFPICRGTVLAVPRRFCFGTFCPKVKARRVSTGPQPTGFGEAPQQAFLQAPRGAKIASVYTLALLAVPCNPENGTKKRSPRFHTSPVSLASLIARIIVSTSRKSFSSIELSITSMRLLHPLAAPLSG